MIKRLTFLASIALLAALPASASVTLSLDAGLLTDQNGNVISDGDLVLLLASPSGVISPTVGSSFVSGDNIIVSTSGAGGSATGALAMNSSVTTPGETFNVLTFDYGVGATGTTTFSDPSFVVGDQLAIRWYTDFTLAEFEAGDVPTSGYYGTYYPTLLTPNDDGGVNWVGPADGGAYTGAQGLNFFTTTDPLGGDQPAILGEALTPVVSGDVAVPEPSTYALLAIGLLVCAGIARKKKLAPVAK